MNNIRQIFVKEFNSFFSSPAAWLFLGSFLIVNLFLFFWEEAFFARNIADLKPLFQWMPVLLIFLVAALTMRSWSEERRAGTLESLLTSPVPPLQLVLGKFIAGLALVSLALLLTFPLVVTVFLLGPLDWGPVIGGYVASLFLASAYISIGLYMSARTDNPIVSLILTVAVSGFFYLLGSSTLTGLFGHNIGEGLKLLGTGSRFESITRGVLDLRDIYYYCSIVGIFLTLNLFSLERLRWAGNSGLAPHKAWILLTGLIVLNFFLVNIWLFPIGQARVDLTQGKIYSLSTATRQYLQHLQEPLLIRGYFSAKTHPLLEPLVPRVQDLLKEYQVAGGDKVRVEFVDPHTDQAAAEEAADKYGIHPVPFRMASRYQTGVVNSYFDLLIAYGDQYETLSFRDLIEVKVMDRGEPEVLLKNPEYAITRALRKVTGSYRAGGNVFANLQKPLTFYGYFSGAEKLPEVLVDLQKQLSDILQDLKKSAGDKLKIEFADPDAEGGKLGQQLQQEYGFEPQIASLFDPKPFWFYMVLKGENETVQVPLPQEMNKEELKKSILAAVQRMAPGYLKTVALVTPLSPPMNPYMPSQEGGKRYSALRSVLSENVRLKDIDLKNGIVPADVDLLLVLAPDNLNEKQLFAVDQFLMQGGSVIVATSPFDVKISSTLQAVQHKSGLRQWLENYGIIIADTMVLDPQNASLPVPVRRQLGPIAVNEIQMMPYPHFPDIRGNELNSDSPITSALGQLTLNWASPITVAEKENSDRKVIDLLRSSDKSWTSDSLNVLPDYQQFPQTGFKQGKNHGSKVLAVALTGRFNSWFKGKKSPLLEAEQASDSFADPKKENGEAGTNDKTIVSGVIERSSDSAKIILIASNTFACDTVINLASQGQGTQYTRPLEFLQNSIDWSLDDDGLMSIRSRASFARMLQPMQQKSRLFWEYLNYGLALFGLGLVWLWRLILRRRKQVHYERVLAEV